MRRQDVYGIDRPASQGRITPMMALPDSTDLTQPIRLPRPHVGTRSVIYDIHDRSVIYSSEEVGRPFPRHLSSRRLSSQDLSDLTPPSQIRNPSPQVRIRKGVSLQALETATDDPPRTMIPRVVIPGQTVAQPPAEITVGEPPLRNPSPVLLTRPTVTTAAIQRQETQSIESIEEDILEIHTRALYNNSSLSYQRFIFSLTKFPALVLVLVSLWTLWGRGEGLNQKIQNEQRADITALVTGGFVLSCQVLLLHQHYNCYKKAKIMSYLYHFSMLLSFCGAVIALVFAATTFTDLKGVNGNDPFKTCKVAKLDSTNVPHPEFCLRPQERIDYMAVVIGSSSLIIILSILTMTFGAIGQALMKKRLSEEYQKITAQKAYTNEAMQY